MVAHGQVKPLALLARARHRGPHVAHPERVDDARSPGRLDLGPHRGQPGPGLAGRDDVPQPERERVHADLARPLGEVGRERERAEDRVDAEPRDQVEQPARLAGAHRHDGRAARLERHVVGDAARVERVVEAVRDRVAGAHAGDPERLAAHGAVRLVVRLREPHRHGLAGGAGGHVHAHEPLARRAQVRPERRIRALALAELVLRGEREPRQVGRGAHVLADAAEPLGVERARRRQVGELLLERGHSRGGSSPAAASSSVPLTVRP